MIDTEKLQPYLGSSFTKRMTVELILLSFSRDWLVCEAKTGNFAAAARLSRLLKKLHVDTVDELLKLDPLTLAREKGVGETTVYVLLRIQERLRKGGAKLWETEGVTWRTLAVRARGKKRGRK